MVENTCNRDMGVVVGTGWGMPMAAYKIRKGLQKGREVYHGMDRQQFR